MKLAHVEQYHRIGVIFILIASLATLHRRDIDIGQRLGLFIQ